MAPKRTPMDSRKIGRRATCLRSLGSMLPLGLSAALKRSASAQRVRGFADLGVNRGDARRGRARRRRWRCASQPSRRGRGRPQADGSACGHDAVVGAGIRQGISALNPPAGLWTVCGSRYRRSWSTALGARRSSTIGARVRPGRARRGAQVLSATHSRSVAGSSPAVPTNASAIPQHDVDHARSEDVVAESAEGPELRA